MPQCVKTMSRAILLAALAVSTARAQTRSTPDAVPNEVTIYATKSERSAFDIPSMVTAINADNAALAGSATVKNLLAGVSGLEFNGSARRNGQDFILRGYNTDGVVVLFDGVRQRFESMHDGKFFIDPQLIKRAEVVRGPYSTLYGSGALGGVVAFETKTAADLLQKGQQTGFRAAMSNNSVNTENMASLTAYHRHGALDIVGQVVARQSGDIALSDGTDLASDDSYTNLMLKLSNGLDEMSGYSLTFHAVEGTAQEPDDPQERVGRSGVLPNIDKELRAYTFNAGYHYDDLRLRLYGTNVALDEQIPEIKSREHANIGVMANYQTRGDAFGLKHIATYGLEIFSEELTSSDARAGYANSIPNAKATHQSFFLQDEIIIGTEGAAGSVYIVPALRFDSYESDNANGLSQNESHSSAKLGTSWRVFDSLVLFANSAEGFRAPDLSEIYAEGTHFQCDNRRSVFCGPSPRPSATSDYRPNTNLKPEKNETTELGFGLAFADMLADNDSLQIKAASYQTDATDFIVRRVEIVGSASVSLPGVPRPISLPRFGDTIIENIPTATIDGIEVDMRYRVGGTQVTLGYAESEGRRTDTGDFLPNMQPTTSKLGIAQDMPRFNLTFGARATLADDYTDRPLSDEGRPQEKIDGYTLVDIFAQWQATPALLLNLSIDNASDAEYRRSFSPTAAPRRNFRAHLSYKW